MKLPTTKILSNLQGAKQRGLDNVEYGILKSESQFVPQKWTTLVQLKWGSAAGEKIKVVKLLLKIFKISNRFKNWDV